MNMAQSDIIASENKPLVTAGDTSLTYPMIRPQRLHTWLNLIPIAEYEANKPKEILFLDTFATIEHTPENKEQPYTVLFEGKTPMTVKLHIGIIFVWYGEKLNEPDRPFPTLFKETYPTKYVTSVPVIFENTHVMDFVENGSDNLHFKHVHQWEYSKIYNHKVTDTEITLEQDTRINYGRCSFNRFIRFMSYILPKLELHHDYVYHGPGIAVVGAEGAGSPESHNVVTLTPEGENRTRVYVTIAMPESTFPAWAEKAFQTVTGGKKLCDGLSKILSNYIKNEFDVDAVIWKDRKVMHQYNLLPNEQHLQRVIDWGKTFYPKDFDMPPEPEAKPDDAKDWVTLDDISNIKQGKINSYKVGEQNFIAYRDSKNDIKVRDAHCPHQGAHLGVEGRIEDDCVRCPFHGFYYGPEGECRGANVNNTNKPLEGLQLPQIETRLNGSSLEIFA